MIISIRDESDNPSPVASGVFAPLCDNVSTKISFNQLFGSWVLKQSEALIPLYEKLDINIHEQTLSKDILFLPGDKAWEREDPHTIVFKRSLMRSTIKDNEMAYPAFIHKKWPGNSGVFKVKPTAKRKPVVGFRGFNRPEIRHQLNTAIIESPLLDSRITEKDRFLGGVMGYEKDQYIKSILDSDFVPSCSGIGNFSYRLYETLSLGKVPIVVDTDIVLPFWDLIPWKKHCIFLKVSDIPNVGQFVMDFMEQHTEKSWKELQVENRAFWLEYLSPQGWLKHIAPVIEKTFSLNKEIK